MADNRKRGRPVKVYKWLDDTQPDGLYCRRCSDCLRGMADFKGKFIKIPSTASDSKMACYGHDNSNVHKSTVAGKALIL